MASRRELLARIGRAATSRVFGAVQSAVSDFGKGTLERIANALEEGLASEPPKPQTSPASKPRATARTERREEEPDEQQAQKREAEGLLANLQTLQITTRQIVERLSQLGYRESAEAIYRVPEVPNLGDRGAVPEAPPPTPEVKPKPKKREKAPIPEAPAKPKKREKAPIPEAPAKPTEAKYRLQGTLIHVPYTKNLKFLYRMLASEWKRIGLGKKKDGTPQPEGNVYAADAILQAKAGSTADAGIRIPPEVLGNEEAFVDWAKANGYENGGSIVVDGMVPPPGGAFAGERVWTVDAEKYRHLDTDEDR
jgi:hypothetical protein